MEDKPYFKADKSNRSPYLDMPEIEIVEDSFDKAAAEAAGDRNFDDYLCDLYDYVGAYYGWSWTEFKATPPHIVRKLKSRIDKKFENIDEEVFSYSYLAVIMALAKAFGGK